MTRRLCRHLMLHSAVLLTLQVVVASVAPIRAQQLDERARIERPPASSEIMKEWREKAKAVLFPASFTRDMSERQAIPVSDLSPLRQSIRASLREMGFVIAVQPVPSYQTERHAWFEYRKIVNDSPEYRDVESVDIRVRLFPDHQEAESGFVMAAMGPSIGFQPGAPDGSSVGEASAFAALDARRQVTVFVLRRNASFEVRCGGTVREPKMANSRTASVDRMIMPELPSRCTDIAKLVDQWLRNAE